MTETLFIREFEIDLSLREADGVVEGLVVPYDREADVADLLPEGVVRYREVFRPGAFERAEKVPNRVVLTYTHDESLPAVLGYGSSFRDTPEGLWGSFRLYPSRADIARDVLTTSHKAFSVGFRSLNPRHGTVEKEGALVERRSVHLRHVAAVPEGAYAGALVASVREAIEEADAAEQAETEAAALRQAAADARAANEAVLRELDGLFAAGQKWRQRFSE